MSFPHATIYKTHPYSLYEHPLEKLPELKTLQKTVCLKNNIIPDKEIDYDLYDSQYFAHLHDLQM
jgi:hypothetical protein